MAAKRSKRCWLTLLNSSALAVFLAFAALSGCRSRPGTDVKWVCRVLPEPPRVGPEDVQISLLDSRNQLIPGAQISIEANMSHPGMQPLFAHASARGDTTYRAALNFSMPGDWVLSLHATLSDGASADAQLPLTVRED
jgi:YtkA-like